MKCNIYQSVVQLSPALFSCCSRYVRFVELIHVNDLLDDETFIFSTNQRPAKIYHALTYSQTSLLEPLALQATPGLKIKDHLLRPFFNLSIDIFLTLFLKGGGGPITPKDF